MPEGWQIDVNSLPTYFNYRQNKVASACDMVWHCMVRRVKRDNRRKIKICAQWRKSQQQRESWTLNWSFEDLTAQKKWQVIFKRLAMRTNSFFTCTFHTPAEK